MSARATASGHRLSIWSKNQNPREWRPCGDYRALNSDTIPDRYLLPHIRDCVSSLHGMKVFSTIDLVRAYHKIPIAPEEVPKTAITTHFGSFEFLRMPFGLRNASQTFQRFIDCVLRGLDFCCAYVDDILIASKNEEEHLRHLEEVFRRLDDNGLVVNADKCSFGRAEVSFLGHMVNDQGVRPLQAKVKAVTEYPNPRTRRQLRRFLGMINFYRRLIPNCAEVAASLTPPNQKLSQRTAIHSLSQRFSPKCVTSCVACASPSRQRYGRAFASTTCHMLPANTGSTMCLSSCSASGHLSSLMLRLARPNLFKGLQSGYPESS